MDSCISSKNKNRRKGKQADDNEGVLVKLQPVNKNISEEDSYFEILVLESEVEEAHNILYELWLLIWYQALYYYYFYIVLGRIMTRQDKRRNTHENIAVLTSGGDALGMNAAIRAVVRMGINKGLMYSE